MTKKAAPLSAGLVAVKGSAIAAADVPTRSPATRKPKAKNDTPLNFRMTADFVKKFKRRAVEDELKLNELLERAFAAYCAKAKVEKDRM